jgi:hypothetical protein
MLIRCINSPCSNTKVKSINIQHKKSSHFTFNKTVKSIQSYGSKVESYNTKVNSVQLTCSNNTKVKSFNVKTPGTSQLILYFIYFIFYILQLLANITWTSSRQPPIIFAQIWVSPPIHIRPGYITSWARLKSHHDTG